MAENSIDLVVSERAFEQLERLLDEIKKADNAITSLRENAGKNPTTPSGGEANAAENAKIIAQMKELTAEINKQAEAATKLAAARKPSSRTITQETIETRAFNAAETQRLQLASDKIGAYQKLDIEVKKLTKSAQDEAAALVKVSVAGETSAEQIKRLGAEMQRIDAGVGKYNRNVGNYASGWNGLANSVNQLTREAPAFAVSLNTGFLALSNNIPILADELNNLKVKNEKLAESGKPTESIVTTLAKSFFSWQTVLSVGVTLLTLYGGKLVDMARGLGDVESALKRLDKAQKDSDARISNTTRNIEAQTAIAIANAKMRGASQKELDDLTLKGKKDVLLNLQKERDLAKKTYDEANEFRKNGLKNIKTGYEEEVRLAQKASDEKRKLTGGFGREELKNLEEANKKHEKELTRIKTNGSDEVFNVIKRNAIRTENAVKTEGQKLVVLEKDLQASQYEAAKASKDKLDKLNTKKGSKEEEERLEREYKALLSGLERQKEIDKDVLTSFKGGIDEKIKLSLQLARDEINIANIVFREKERLAKGDVDLITDATNKKDTAEENAAQENLKRVAKYYEDYNKLAEEYYKKNPPLFMESKERKAEREKKEAEDKKRLEESANYMKSFIADFANSSSFQGMLYLFEGENSLFKRMSKGLAFTKDSWKEDTVAMMEAAQEMYNFITNASQQNFDAEYARLESQKDIAMQFAGESASARIGVEEDYEKRKKEIVNRENQAKKKQAMFNIAIDTAQGIISALAMTPPNIPLSIIIGVLGAAQLAMVAAQKIPQYFDGTDNHPGGLALINDGKGSNYKETVVTPDGKVRQFSGRDVMIDAPAGTQVFTHDQWNNELNTMMREKGISMSNSFNSRSGLSYAEMDSIIAKHFSKITTQSTVIDRNGFNTFVSNGTSKTIRNQSRYSGAGFSV